MTALDPASVPDTGGLAALAGEMAAGQLTPLVTVLRAEQARRTAGIAISRPAWKNLVFTGGPRHRQIPRRRRHRPPVPRPRRAELRQSDRTPRRRPGRRYRPGYRDADPRGGQGHRRPGDDYRRARLARPARPRPAPAPLPVPAPDRSPEVPRRPTRHHPGRPGPLRDMLHAAPALAAASPPSSTSPATPPPSSLPSCRPWPPKPDSPSPLSRPQSRASWPCRERPRTGNARLASSCSLRPPPARRTASPPVPSAATRPPSARTTSPNACQSPPHPHAISTRASTSDRRVSGRAAAPAGSASRRVTMYERP